MDDDDLKVKSVLRSCYKCKR